MSDERRRDERVGMPLEVRWEGLSGAHVARISDISVSGCYIETLGQVAEGEDVRFEVMTPTGRWLKLRGDVAHYYPNIGFGVRFKNLSEAERDVLASIVDFARME